MIKIEISPKEDDGSDVSQHWVDSKDLAKVSEKEYQVNIETFDRITNAMHGFLDNLPRPENGWEVKFWCKTKDLASLDPNYLCACKKARSMCGCNKIMSPIEFINLHPDWHIWTSSEYVDGDVTTRAFVAPKRSDFLEILEKREAKIDGDVTADAIAKLDLKGLHQRLEKNG